LLSFPKPLLNRVLFRHLSAKKGKKGLFPNTKRKNQEKILQDGSGGVNVHNTVAHRFGLAEAGLIISTSMIQKDTYTSLTHIIIPFS